MNEIISRADWVIKWMSAPPIKCIEAMRDIRKAKITDELREELSARLAAALERRA